MELVDSKVGTYAVCIKLKSLKYDFVWGLIGVYGPNDDSLRYALFDELKLFLSLWDIPWCLGGDFNVVRCPVERTSGGGLSRQCWNFLTLSILVVLLTFRWKVAVTLSLATRMFQYCLAVIVLFSVG